ncbi:apolipoprotein A-IV-like precursor [Silurus asotus]|uniref:Apolipoprotein A-IV-like n=1 Tax=Silurus asotus TaxID=30991 RepID=A0AAD5APF4_SILAS|nr:apolipoprotein A-IV-like precursor [Silurus asotus]
MKVFLVLALAVFTGCQANLFNADEPKPQLEQLTDAFWDYVAKATHTAEDTLKIIRESQLGQEVKGSLEEKVKELQSQMEPFAASEYAVTLQKQVSPMAQDIMTEIFQEAEVLKERLEQDLITLKGKMEPYSDDMKTQIQQKMEELRVAVAPYAESIDTEALKTTVLQKTDELRGSLEEKVKELQSQMEPFAEQLRQKVDQHMQEFQNAVAPLTDDLQTKVAERAALVQQGLAPYSEDLREKLGPYTQNLKDQLTSLYESFSKTN